MPGDSSLKREGKAFVLAQSAWDTVAYPTSASAFKFTGMSIKETPEREIRTDQVDTRSEGATIEGRTTVEWSAEGFYMPSGAPGTPADIGPFQKAITGIQTTGGTTVYTLKADLETVVFGLSIWYFGSFLGIGVKNAIVNELSIKASGSGQSTFSMSGQATTMMRAGSGTLSVGGVATNTTITLQTGEGVMYTNEIKIDIGSETGFTISGVSGDVLTFSPALAGTQGIGSVVKPNVQTPTYIGNPISKVRGSFDLGGATYKILEGEVKISDPSAIRNDEFGSAIASGFDSTGERSIKFTGQARLLKTNFKEVGGFIANTQKALNFTIGDVAGSRGKFAFPAVEGLPPAIESPDDAPMVMALEFSAKPTANENELVWTED